MLWKRLKEEQEQKRREHMEEQVEQIEQFSRKQIELLEEENFYLKQQVEISLQKADNAEKGEKIAILLSVISILADIIIALVK